MALKKNKAMNMAHKIIFSLVFVTVFAHSKTNYLPGGENVRQAISERQGKTPLSKLAINMEPGTWAELKTKKPGDLWRAPQPSKGLHIGTWSDDGHWDSRTGQFIFFGVRQARKLVAYSEEKNAWRDIKFHGKKNAPELLQNFGHQYSLNSLDANRSRYFTRTTGYSIVEDTWFQLPPITFARSFMVFEYFSAMDGLVGIAREKKPGTIVFYSQEKESWGNLGVSPVHGYHSMARHNPYMEEVLLAGGNDTRAVVVITKSGKLKRMDDFPLNLKLTIRHSILTVDPLSGRYLFLVPGKKFVEFDSAKNEYRLIDDFSKTKWPFHHYDSPIVAFIPEYGVTMWVDRKVHLYKHKISTSRPL